LKHPQAPMAKVGRDLGVFKKLPESKKPLTVEDLAEPSGAGPSASESDSEISHCTLNNL
jgi:hypothetical protein